LTHVIPSKPSSAAGRAAAWGGLFAAGMVAGLGLSRFTPRRHKAAARATPAAIAPTTPKPQPSGWRTLLVRGVREFSKDRIPAQAAAVTFYVLLALFPALSAFASIYGLFADVDDARRLLSQLNGLLPGGALSVLSDQLVRLAAADNGKLGVAFAVSLLVSVWSANAGIKALFAGLNVAYEARERRRFIQLNLISLAFTAGAIILAVIAIAAMVAAPATLARFGYAGFEGAAILRWPAFLILATVLFSLLYRFGPCLGDPHWRWITPGGVLAAVGWMAMSILFSFYVANFGHYDRTYGSLGAIVGFLTWIWLSLMVVLFGAELNSEIEKAQRPLDPSLAAGMSSKAAKV
jgi:membrane protein